MKLQSIYGLILAAAAAVGLLAAVPGCIADDYRDCNDPALGGSPYRISVTVIASSSMSSRAGHDDDFEEKGISPENYINFTGKDFRIILFDNTGSYLCELDTDRDTEILSTPGDNIVYYIIDTKIEFPETVSETVIDGIRREGFQVIALANWQSIDGHSSYTGLFDKGGGQHQSLAEIWRDNSRYNFVYTPQADKTTWQPDHTAATKRLIPMFGFAKATPFAERHNGGVLYSAASIPMQRALAKIEVFDNLTQTGISVDDVTMTSFNTSGRFIPDVEQNSGWDEIGSQVGKSSLPQNVLQDTELKFFRESAKKWVAYVPEMQLEAPSINDKGEVQDSRPHLEVDVKGNLEFYKGGTYPVHFLPYDENSMPTEGDQSWNHILRNHIYRFSINKVGLSVKLHLHVIPWEIDDDEEWDFTDHVTVSQRLQWNEQTYEKIDDNGDIYLLLDNDKWLEGQFGIMSPTNGRWYARLTPLDDAKINAVSFVDERGDVMTPSAGDPPACLEISGLIGEGGTIPIRIRPTDYGNDYESRFRLEFFVENLGVWLNVPMVENGSYKCYTIVRKANIIEANL